MKRAFFVPVLSLLAIGAAFGQVIYSGGTYAQDFNTLSPTGTTNTWTDNSTLLGWYSTRTQYAADAGSSNTGRQYSYGQATTDSERALGSIASGTSGTIQYGARFTNAMGGNSDFFVLQYTGEQWRNGGNTTAHKLAFEYSLDATSLGTGTWNAFTLLDFTGPVATASAGALNGNLAANRVLLNQTVNLSTLWNSGADLWIRWTDVNDAGNDHGLALDDLSFTSRAQPVPEPATMAALGLGALALIRRRNRK